MPAPALLEDHETASEPRRGPRNRHPSTRPSLRVIDLVDVPASDPTLHRVPAGPDVAAATAPSGVDPELWALHVRYRRGADPSALAQLMAHYDGYACSMARRLHRGHEPLADLRQVAREGLLTALHRFDPDRGLPFPALASPTILGALRRHFRDRGWAVRVPRRVHEIAGASSAAEERLTRRLGRVPRADELAGELGISLDDLLEAQDAVHCRSTASLEGLGAAIDGMTRDRGRDATTDDLEDRLVLADALAQLSERERQVVGLYFFDGMAQSQIAEQFGVSQMQVSRWLSSVMRRLRGHLGA